ncbi:MAG TPA: hypothetical protein VFJ79_07505, partial [Acidimicrobiales bacterium]|nr:hypothetical protein [Acidimicrobiales bacterium]
MTAVDEHRDEIRRLRPEDTRPAGRWNAAGVPGERSKDFGAVARRLVTLLAAERDKLALVAITSVAGVVMNVFGPKVLGHGTDVIIRGFIRHHINFTELDRILLLA